MTLPKVGTAIDLHRVSSTLAFYEFGRVTKVNADHAVVVRESSAINRNDKKGTGSVKRIKLLRQPLAIFPDGSIKMMGEGRFYVWGSKSSSWRVRG